MDRLNRCNKVRTLQLSNRTPGDWHPDAEKDCRWGVTGRITHVSDSHGVCYRVEHEDGSSAWYEPAELELLPESPPSIGDNKPAGEL